MARPFQNIILICPDNDAESRLILVMAYKLGMTVIRSCQGHGAKLERERGGIIPLVQAVGGGDTVWIVEIPGQDVEQELKRLGYRVVVIDHHTYGQLDRSRDFNGYRLPSSLHQFMKLAFVTDERIRSMGLDPVIVHGVSIMDARYVQGLREEGFTLDERRRVLTFIKEYSMAGNPSFVEAQQAALGAWRNRQMLNGYIVVRSNSKVGIRGAVSAITIEENCDTSPFILDDAGCGELFVQNVTIDVVDRLMCAFANARPFTFGSGRCWGVNNRDNGTKVTLDHILGVLS